MTQWRIKQVSDMTNVSIRMLRHYDKINLLTPSYRAANGYRWYTEGDLAKLQQIVALKYFGFKLNTIQLIMQKSQNIYAHLHAQQQVLKKQTLHLNQVSDALSQVLKRLEPTKAPDWNDLITLIERYQMSENLRDKLKKSWAGKTLTESQFEEYLFIYEQFPEEFSERDRIIEKVNKNEFGDPEGPDGEAVIVFMHNLAKKAKGSFSKQVKINSSLLENVKSGKLTNMEVTPEGVMWLSRAMLSYWLRRWDTIYNDILNNLTSDPAGKIGNKIASEWTDLINDFLSVGNQPLIIGVMIWQQLAKQKNELNEFTTVPSPQEMIKHFHVKLLFNPEAVSWISRALEIHASECIIA